MQVNFLVFELKRQIKHTSKQDVPKNAYHPEHDILVLLLVILPYQIKAKQLAFPF